MRQQSGTYARSEGSQAIRRRVTELAGLYLPDY